MKTWTRRRALSIAAAFSAVGMQLEHYAVAEPAKPGTQPTRTQRMVHITDLFRPHHDPGDDRGLATACVLARAGGLGLAVVLTDNPENVEEEGGTPVREIPGEIAGHANQGCPSDRQRALGARWMSDQYPNLKYGATCAPWQLIKYLPSKCKGLDHPHGLK